MAHEPGRGLTLQRIDHVNLASMAVARLKGGTDGVGRADVAEAHVGGQNEDAFHQANSAVVRRSAMGLPGLGADQCT